MTLAHPNHLSGYISRALDKIRYPTRLQLKIPGHRTYNNTPMTLNPVVDMNQITSAKRHNSTFLSDSSQKHTPIRNCTPSPKNMLP